MTTWVLGIDPGAQGALAIYDVTNAHVVLVKDMPNYLLTLTTGKESHRVDIKALAELFAKIIERVEREEIELKIHIEKVQAFGKQSAPAAFNFGYASAVPFALSVAYGYTPALISPVVWKRRAGLQASKKDDARLLVRHLFPYLCDKLKFKYNVDRADAILIAMYKP